MEILASNAKVDGGNFARLWGHDFGFISPSTAPFGVYSEVYHARVQPNQTLVTSALLVSTPTCGEAQDENLCTSNAYPLFMILIEDGSQQFGQGNFAQNYQKASVKNTTGNDKFYNIKLIVFSWNGVASTSFGLAWNTYGDPA
jgi:hypothetical protein